MEYIITIKELNTKLNVSIRTFYKVVNNEIGVLKGKEYTTSLDVIKKYPRLYNRLRQKW